MFDSNIIDALDTIMHLVNNSLDKYEYYICDIQIKELGDASDEEKQKLLFSNLKHLQHEKLAAPLILDSTKTLLDSAPLARRKEVEIFYTISENRPNNLNDDIIAATGFSEECTLVTNDKKFFNRMKKNNYPVQNLKNFTDELNEYLQMR